MNVVITSGIVNRGESKAYAIIAIHIREYSRSFIYSTYTLYNLVNVTAYRAVLIMIALVGFG